MRQREASPSGRFIARTLCVVALFGGGCSKAERAAPAAEQHRAERHLSQHFDPTRPLPKQTCKLFPKLKSPTLKLSQTGCVDPSQPKEPAASLVPYDVVSPLWSDGASKQRFLALPDVGKIKVKDCVESPNECHPIQGTPSVNGDWELPVGTVLVKTFLLDGRFVETRLLMRFSRDTWAGYSYAWNADQTDAEVLPDAIAGVERTFPTKQGPQAWHFPSRSECFQCHTGSAGVSLGLESSQMNRTFQYSAGHLENQIDVLARLAAFDVWPPRHRPQAYADPSDTRADLSARARSYLHANCAVCHTPGGRFDTIDLRATTEFAETGLCDSEPRAQGGSLGVSGARLLVPNQPARSVLSLRMHALPGAYRMPPLASTRVDHLGAALIDSWIASLKKCM